MDVRVFVAIVSILAGSLSAPSLAQSSSSDKARPLPDPNQKICETVTTIGTRLGAKKVCATRAQWAEKRRQDRESLDDAQRGAHIGCSVTPGSTLTPTPVGC